MALVDIEKLGTFYLGRTELGPYLFDSKNLTTHGVVIGMTGSGKTGLSIALLEEAAIDGIPAIVVDPKGDLGNLLLGFPDLSPASFAPWVPEGADPAAEAAKWAEGLRASGQDGARIQRMRDTVDLAIYTPGSRSGRPLSVLGSLKAPPRETVQDLDAIADRTAQVATSLLGLVGIEVEAGRSREHALLATILDDAWRKGEDLDLAGLVGRIQTPPFQRIGVLDLASFFPDKDRFQLAIAFNAVLASPGFSAFLEGEPLDVAALLRTTAGKPRISILSIAHLGDTERMFFVSLLLGELVGWMRKQPGTPSLRALFFMDEILGYFPPVANPPSKAALLVLLKQARAFGLGCVLATQNPVDLDYKGLANAGTWMIGRLQTERDKARVLDGLEGVSAGHGFDRATMDKVLSGLPKRHFYMHCVHEAQPAVIESRWALSYLRGPLTRDEVVKLAAATKKDEAAGPTGTVAVPQARAAAPVDASGATTTKPVVPPGIQEVFLPASSPNPTYRPYAYGAARVAFEDAKTGLDFVREVAFVTPVSAGPVPLSWDDAKWAGRLGPRDLGTEAAPGARFISPPAPMLAAKSWPAWSKELAAWLARTQGIARLKHAPSKTFSRPDEDERAFRARLALGTREQRDAKTAKVREKYQAKLEALASKIQTKQAAVAREQAEQAAQRTDFAASLGGSLLGLALGGASARRAISAAGTAARGAGRAKKNADDVARVQQDLDALMAKYRELEEQARQELATATGEGDPSTAPLENVVVKPKKTGITVVLCALAWVPE